MKKNRLSFTAILFLAAACLAILVPNLGQYQLSPISYLLIQKYGLTDVQYSQLFTSAMIPGALLSLISGLLCDRYGAIKCCTAAILISTACGVARLFCGGYTALFICTAATGISCTFLNANAPKIVGGIAGPSQRSRLLGIMVGGAPAGTFIGMAVTAKLFSTVEAVFLSLAILFVLSAAFWLFTVWVVRRDRQLLANLACPESSEAAAGAAGIGQKLYSVVRSPTVWGISLSLFLFNGCNVSVSTFLPLALQEAYGFSASSAGLTASFLLLGSLIGYVLGAPILTLLRSKRVMFLCLSQVIFLAGILGVIFIPYAAIQLPLAIVAGCVGSTMLSSLLSIPMQLPSIGFSQAGTAGGFISTMQLLGGVVIPSSLIANIPLNYQYKVIFSTSCLVVSTVLLLLMRGTFKKYLR